MSKGSATLLVTLCLPLLAAAPSQAASSPTYQVPTGSYMATCKDCTLGTGTSYSCTCNNKNHSPQSTTINLSNCAKSSGLYSLTNNNGSLVCDQHGSSSPVSVASAIKIPTGSYGVTCMNCSINAGSRTFSCYCENGSNMITQNSSISYVNCPKDSNGFNELTNQYGTLVCTK